MRLDTEYVQVTEGVATPTVVAILDRHGELAACVADVRSVEEHLTPAHMLSRLAQEAFPQASLLVCETNLSSSSLHFLCSAAHQKGVPVLLEPVSVAKSKRATGCLPYLAWITPNLRELLAIAEDVCCQDSRPFAPGPILQQQASNQQQQPENAGMAFNGSSESQALEHMLEELAHCASILLLKGTQRVLVTLGSSGAALLYLRCNHPDSNSSNDDGTAAAAAAAAAEVVCMHLPALPPSGPIASLSGAGDTLVGALAAALTRDGQNDDKPALSAVSPQAPAASQAAVVKAVALGMAAATCAIQSAQNVPLGLAWAGLEAGAERIRAGVSVRSHVVGC